MGVGELYTPSRHARHTTEVKDIATVQGHDIIKPPKFPCPKCETRLSDGRWRHLDVTKTGYKQPGSQTSFLQFRPASNLSTTPFLDTHQHCLVQKQNKLISHLFIDKSEKQV
ncbi:hypothetical protein Pmani_016550 [Petrolisthes manimaculis]|uniref:Uncharacterized protein n=1 Tax=Petrolisthes manimaculis TaxID=1843537 RepID=A0AAE1PQ46_9EUCA|nr:hypothetical protein Pmani_016550 [Petrolisthes manimaculis]